MSTPEGRDGLALRLAALTHKQRHLTGATDEAGCPDVVLRGTNLRVVSDLGRAGCTGESGEPIPDCPNGVGNLILAANEPRAEGFNNLHTGSLYVVAVKEYNFSHVGGLVVGLRPARRGDFARGYRGRAPRPAERAFNWASGRSSPTSEGPAAGVALRGWCLCWVNRLYSPPNHVTTGDGTGSGVDVARAPALRWCIPPYRIVGDRRASRPGAFAPEREGFFQRFITTAPPAAV
jgi:hypothetical protein